jgi:hypothetical protein
MVYRVIRSANVPDESEWRVEAINYDGDGEVYLAIFSGPSARERAEEYAAFKTSRVEQPA